MKSSILLIIALIGWACSETDGPASKRSGAKGQSGGSGASDSAEANNGNGTADDAGNTADEPGDDDANGGDETDGTTGSNGTDDVQADAGEDDGQATDGGTQDPDAPCAGKRVGGGCWYVGEHGSGCTFTCATHGGYNELTRTFAGDQGTLAHCEQVIEAIGGGDTTVQDKNAYSPDPYFALGCVHNALSGDLLVSNFRIFDTPTTPQAGEGTPGYSRICACNN